MASSIAFSLGYDAGFNGYDQDVCPYEEDGGAYWDWIDGWNKAVDYWQGMPGDCEAPPATVWQEMIVRL